ncbi:MAG TPA: hypothetical protein VJS92_11705 [Candidatus Polarisedimenticolaceae bacterium]|nr:hypothetical protein [Candidatus Polarisedimenticolaceae bacterium]
MRLREAVLGLVVASCALAHAEEPAWLAAARAREGELRKPKEIQSSDHFFRARVPAKLAGKIEPDQGAYLVRLDASTGAPVECLVFQEAQDLAGFLRAAAKASYEAIEQARGKVAAKAVERVDAGAIGGSPFLAVDWTHRIENPGQPPAVGMLKQLAAAKDGHAIYCVHDEVGYARTFRSLAEALIDSLVFAGPAQPPPYRSEISTLSTQGMRVSVDRVTYTRDADGDTKIEHMTASLLPRETGLSSSDEVLIQWVRGDGSLINSFSVSSSDGEVATELKLDPRDGGQWAVSGKFKARPFEAQLPVAKPATILGDALQLQARLAAPDAVGSVLRAQTWLPGVDPGRLQSQELSIVRALGDGRFAARLKMAELAADLVVDGQGSAVSGTITLGPVRLELERVFAAGEI